MTRAPATWRPRGTPRAAAEQAVGCATNFRTQRLIIAGAGESQTPDATAASSRLLGSMTRKDLGDVHLWGHNCWHHFMGDHAVSTLIIPLNANETLVRTKWLVHKDARSKAGTTISTSSPAYGSPPMSRTRSWSPVPMRGSAIRPMSPAPIPVHRGPAQQFCRLVHRSDARQWLLTPCYRRIRAWPWLFTGGVRPAALRRCP